MTECTEQRQTGRTTRMFLRLLGMDKAQFHTVLLCCRKEEYASKALDRLGHIATLLDIPYSRLGRLSANVGGREVLATGFVVTNNRFAGHRFSRCFIDHSVSIEAALSFKENMRDHCAEWDEAK